MTGYAGFVCPKCLKKGNDTLANWEVSRLPEHENDRFLKRYGRRVCNQCKMERIKQLGINPIGLE